MPFQPGQVIENHRIMRQLGAGGQGTTYEAEHMVLHGKRVIKEVNLVGLNQTDRQEAYTEAYVLESLGKINHPNILKVYDTFEIDQSSRKVASQNGDRLIIITAYVEGENLEAYSLLPPNIGRLPEPEVLEYSVQIFSGLKAIHSQRDNAGNPRPITHRDIKPANCMRTPEGNIVIIDFGTALNRVARRGHTQHFGTYGYAAPEQFRANPIPQSDVYAAGAVAYSLLAGREPRYDQNNPLVSCSWLRQDIETLYNNGRGPISEELTEILLNAAVEDPNRRFTSEQAYNNLYGLQQAVKIDLRTYHFWTTHPSKWDFADAGNALHIYQALKDGKARAGIGAVDDITRRIDTHFKTLQDYLDKNFELTITDRLFPWIGQKKLDEREQFISRYLQLLETARLHGFNELP